MAHTGTQGQKRPKMLAELTKVHFVGFLFAHISTVRHMYKVYVVTNIPVRPVAEEWLVAGAFNICHNRFCESRQ